MTALDYRVGIFEFSEFFIVFFLKKIIKKSHLGRSHLDAKVAAQESTACYIFENYNIG